MADAGSFSELMTVQDKDKRSNIWGEVMKLSQKYEGEEGYSRETVLHGLLEGLLSLNHARYDERLYRHPNDIRYFLQCIFEAVNREYDGVLFGPALEEAIAQHGEDLLYLRDKANFGWKPAHTNDNA